MHVKFDRSNDRQGRHFWERSGGWPEDVLAARAFVPLILMVLIYILSAEAMAQTGPNGNCAFISGNEYVFETQYYDGYEYLWETNESVPKMGYTWNFTWAAPPVLSPTAYRINVTVSDPYHIGCMNQTSIEIIVCPKTGASLATSLTAAQAKAWRAGL